MNIFLLIGPLFNIITLLLEAKIKKYYWLKISKAYASVAVFAVTGLVIPFIHQDNINSLNLALDIVFILGLVYLIIRNMIAFVKSYRLVEHKENLHIAIVNILQVIIAFALIYQIIYQYDLNSFKFSSMPLDGFAQYIDFLYFSVVTFATVGYGDIVPVSVLAKFSVICEILLFFVVVTIAITFIGRQLGNKRKQASKG